MRQVRRARAGTRWHARATRQIHCTPPICFLWQNPALETLPPRSLIILAMDHVRVDLRTGECARRPETTGSGIASAKRCDLWMSAGCGGQCVSVASTANEEGDCHRDRTGFSSVSSELVKIRCRSGCSPGRIAERIHSGASDGLQVWRAQTRESFTTRGLSDFVTLSCCLVWESDRAMSARRSKSPVVSIWRSPAEMTRPRWNCVVNVSSNHNPNCIRYPEHRVRSSP